MDRPRGRRSWAPRTSRTWPARRGGRWPPDVAPSPGAGPAPQAAGAAEGLVRSPGAPHPHTPERGGSPVRQEAPDGRRRHRPAGRGVDEVAQRVLGAVAGEGLRLGDDGASSGVGLQGAVLAAGVAEGGRADLRASVEGAGLRVGPDSERGRRPIRARARRTVRVSSPTGVVGSRPTATTLPPLSWMRSTSFSASPTPWRERRSSLATAIPSTGLDRGQRGP